MLDRIPDLLSLSLASKLAGVSPFAFRRLYIRTHLVRYMPEEFFHDGTGRSYIYRYELERALGHKVTLKECWAADRKLDARRRYQRAYRRRVRKGNH